MSAASAPFDARPLIAPVDRQAVRAHATQLREQGRAARGMAGPALIAVFVLAAVFVLVFGVLFLGTTAVVVGGLGDGTPGGFALAPFAPVLLVAAAVGAGVVFFVRARARERERRYRLDMFARANGMVYEPTRASPPLPGMIFDVGTSRRASDLIRGDNPRFVEFANYRYTTGSGKNQTVHTWGYVAVHLGTPLPHIVLDALGNNGLFGNSNLPTSFDKGQRLSLEGDFDRYFSLLCPEGYERDALYLFTPDIMARFIDNAAALDVEIVDDWMFLYAKREFATLDPAMWAWLFSVVGALLEKIDQWERWRDERLTASATASVPPTAPAQALTPPPRGVAVQGRRLKRRVPWIVIGLVGAFALFWVLQTFGIAAGMMGGFR